MAKIKSHMIVGNKNEKASHSFSATTYASTTQHYVAFVSYEGVKQYYLSSVFSSKKLATDYISTMPLTDEYGIEPIKHPYLS